MMPWIAIGSVGVFFCLGCWMGWGRRWRGLIFVATSLAAVFLLGYLMGRWQAGYELFHFVMAGYLVSLPGLTGVLGGAFLGWLGQRHRTA